MGGDLHVRSIGGIVLVWGGFCLYQKQENLPYQHPSLLMNQPTNSTIQHLYAIELIAILLNIYGFFQAI